MRSESKELDRYLREELPKIVGLIAGSRVRSIEIQDGDVDLRITRGRADTPPSTGDGPTLGSEHVIGAIPEDGLAPGTKLITAPVVGVFYHAEQPDRAPLVTEGTHVERGAWVGVIEALQVSTEVESDVEGTVRRMLVDDGQPVEYGQPLVEVLVDA